MFERSRTRAGTGAPAAPPARGPRSRDRPRLRGRAGALGILAGTFLATACERPPPPSLLLIVSDTFRGDAVQCSESSTYTPNLCALAGDGTVFTRAYANAPWTLASVASMMSGNSPGQYARVPPHDPTALRFRVPDEERLLAEVLAERGYDTFYEAENPVATRANALQGLAPWPRPGDGAPALDPRLGFTAEIRRYHSLLPALRYLLQPVRRPFYGLFWFNDPHAPYQPPATRRGHLDVPDLPRPVEFYLGLGHAHRPARGQHKLRDVAQDLSVQEIGFLKRLYLAEVESIDERVGYLLRALELSGRRDRTFVVFTSDHGEAFGEHGNFLHGQGFYDEVSRVPLLLAGPGVPPGMVVEDPVSLLDLMPTLADLLAAPCLESPQGRSLVPYLTGEAGDELRDRPHYLVNPSRAEGTDAVVWGRYKLITTDHDRELELYDLLDDPGETRNRAAERPAVVARLLRAARAQRAVDRERRNALAVAEGRAPEEVRAEDEETRRQLKALGYLD